MALTVRKVDHDVNVVQSLCKTLNISLPPVPYPVKHIEPWRRFDLDRLNGDLLEAAKKPSHIKAELGNASNAYELKSLGEWRKQDELFAKKAMGAIKKIPTDPTKDFFELLLYSYIKEDEIPVLRVKALPDTEVVHLNMESVEPIEPERLGFFAVLVYVEQGAKARIYSVDRGNTFDICSLRVYQEPDSKLEFQLMSESGTSRGAVSYLKSYQENDSTSRYGIFTMDRKNRKFFVENRLQKRAHTEYDGFHTGNASKNDHDFHIVHEGSDSVSNIYFKMALVDHAYAVFWGQTDVLPGTTGCSATQLNKNLLLGKSSRVDAIPKLEIITEDVEASHGSATGEISEEEIFYLMARGLELSEARKLLVYGFIEDVFQRAFRDQNLEEGNEFLDNIWEKTLDIVNIKVQK
ncbi:MAG: SufD family Fe-S cluster assembly protein [Leptospirales bacterium]